MKILLENIEDNRDKFLEIRKTHIGASDVPTILGLNKWRTPLELWAEKTGKTKPAEDNDRFWYGRKAEDLVAELFTRRNPEKSITKANAIYQHQDHEWLTCSPDFFINQNTELLECKTTKYADGWSEEEAPDYAHTQLITQLAVTGIKEGFCGVIIAGDVGQAYYPKFEFNEALWDQIFPVLDHFHQCMVHDLPPDIRAGDVKIINQLYPATHEDEFDMSDHAEIDRLVTEYRSSKMEHDLIYQNLKSVKDNLDEIQAKIRFCMGKHKRARYGDNVFEIKTISKKGYEVRPSSYEQFKIKLAGEQNGN